MLLRNLLNKSALDMLNNSIYGWDNKGCYPYTPLDIEDAINKQLPPRFTCEFHVSPNAYDATSFIINVMMYDIPELHRTDYCLGRFRWPRNKKYSENQFQHLVENFTCQAIHLIQRSPTDEEAREIIEKDWQPLYPTDVSIAFTSASSAKEVEDTGEKDCCQFGDTFEQEWQRFQESGKIGLGFDKDINVPGKEE